MSQNCFSRKKPIVDQIKTQLFMNEFKLIHKFWAKKHINIKLKT